jgi:ABC-2 type transport system ATP-binding protein
MGATHAIRLINLNKTYKHSKSTIQAVNDLCLDVHAGEVFGFLGVNGAGKTTTIRMMLDLIRPTGGSIELFGESPNTKHTILQRVGFVVENPGFYNFMNARDNLQVLARASGSYDKKQVDKLIEQVGLGTEPGQNVSKFSTGMRQRLAIAAALLHDPDLLILDEPTNGLDPLGIQEMRDFIRELAAQAGKTVFLSSHLLTEVEQVCDRIAIIHLGEIVREGKVKDLVDNSRATVRIQAYPQEKAERILSAHGAIEADGSWLTMTTDSSLTSKLVRQLVLEEIEINQVVVQRLSLEELFLDVIRDATPNLDDQEVVLV